MGKITLYPGSNTNPEPAIEVEDSLEAVFKAIKTYFDASSSSGMITFEAKISSTEKVRIVCDKFSSVGYTILGKFKKV